jgi:hypothetical protein
MGWSWRRWFHTLRLAAWTIQVPIALLTNLKNSVPYIIFLSLAALIESSYTDLDQTVQLEGKQDQN